MRYLVDDTRMIAIADAIRNKLNIEDLMTVDQMPDLIMRIETIVKPDPTITFSIELVDDKGTVEYSVPIGTTWEAAINTVLASELYTEGLYLEGNKIRCDSSYQPYNIDYRDYVYSLVDENNNRISKNDVIKEATYHFEYLWFTTNLGEEEYEFDYGMTLGEWCDSEYNTDNYILKADGFWSQDEEYYNESYNINNNTVIESNMSIDLIKYIPMINYSISPIRDGDDLYLTCASNATWESMLGIQVAEYSDPLEEDEYGNLYVYETIPPDEIQSRFIRQYTYHLVDENNNKVHKNDIITSQNYHFEYLTFTMTGAFGAEYYFDYGMTLEEWCNSEYNTDGWWADDTGITNLDYMSYEVNKNTILESNMTINVERFCCFIEGTQIVTTLNGDTQSIESLKEGDLVVSYNVNTKENYLTKIKKLITNPYSISMAKIYLNNGTTLEMTDYHPLYTIEGFKSITDRKYPELKIGNILPTFDNKETIITNIELYKNEKPITTYTLNVVDLDEDIDNDIADNYYANGIIAHNSMGCDQP